MAKPSIFSRDYEKRMKKRRRRLITTIIVIIALGGGIGFKVAISDIDFSNMRAKLQAWVDSGKSNEDLNNEKIVNKGEGSAETNTAESSTTANEEKKETTMDLNMAAENQSADIVKANYVEQNGKKQFKDIESKDGYEYTISESKEKIIIQDKNQNIKLFNVDGTSKDINKGVHISTKGASFYKDSILEQYPQFIWNSQVKFIDDSTVVYVSNMPYFGSDLTDKYVWIKNVDTFTDSQNPNDSRIDAISGKDVTIGTVQVGKGIQITADGVVYYLSADGNISN